jgi:hypothetical protein
MTSAEHFLHVLVTDRDVADSFVVEVCETAAILEENGCGEFEAFREAVRRKTTEMNEVNKNDKTNIAGDPAQPGPREAQLPQNL